MMWRATPGCFRFLFLSVARTAACAIGLLLVQAARAEPCADLPVLVRSADTVVLDEMLLRLIANEAGCTLKERVIDDITIARRMQMLKNGDIAINAATAISEDRRAYAWFSKPYRDNVLRVYAHPAVAPEKWPREYRDLLNTGLTVAVVRQARFGPRYEEVISELRVRNKLWEASSLRDGLAMFRAQPPRVHLLMFDEQGVQESLQETGVRLRATALEVERRPLHLMFSKQRVPEATVARMNAAIDRLLEDGRIADALLKAGLHSSGHPVSQQP